jgi:hypothetical protein
MAKIYDIKTKQLLYAERVPATYYVLHLIAPLGKRYQYTFPNKEDAEKWAKAALYAISFKIEKVG